MRYCKYCGAQAEAADRFCRTCGEPLPERRGRDPPAGDRPPDSGGQREPGGRPPDSDGQREPDASPHRDTFDSPPQSGPRDVTDQGRRESRDERPREARDERNHQPRGGSRSAPEIPGDAPRTEQEAYGPVPDDGRGGESAVPGSAQQPPPNRQSNSGQPPTDPVKDAFLGQVDLYDIATWDARTPVDRAAVSVASALQTARSAALVLAAATLFLGQLAVALSIVLTEPFLGVLATTSILPALAVTLYLWYDDPTTREPFVPLAATFLLTIIFATFAALVNTVLAPGFELFGLVGIVSFFFLVVGPIEEFVKWLAIRAYAYRSDAFKTVVDGVVYGAVAGLGFAAIENFVYIASVYFETAPAGTTAQLESATSVTAQRLFAGPGHIVFSSWAGFYLGLAKFNPENRGPIVVKGLLIAAFIHALYNTLVTVLPTVLPVLALLGFIVVYHAFWLGLLYRKVRRYRDLYRQRPTASESW